MIEFRSLKVLDTFERLFIKWGIDYPVMREIVRMKLMMDQRRVPTISNQGKNKEGNHFIKSLWLYALYGLVLIPFLFQGDHYMFSMSIFIGIVMFLLMTSMISDFSTVLLDLRDKTIFHTKPIHPKTINAAKFVHIVIYMFFLTIAITLIPLVVSVVQHGILFGLLLFVELILINIFILVITALLYLVVLRFFDGERLKDMINYIQIILSIALFVGYQVVIRAFDLVEVNLEYNFQIWHYLLPPFWFAALFEFIMNGNREYYFSILSMMAILFPILFFGIYIKLTPVFEDNLQKLASFSVNRKRKSYRIHAWISSALSRVRQERLIYLFAIKMMKNEREFKLKVYPTLVFSIFFPFLFLLNELRYTSFEEIANSKHYFNIYFSLLIIPTVVSMLKYSERYKGAWIFYALPIQNSAVIHKGTLKAVYVHLFLPLFLILAGIFTWIFSTTIVPDLIVVLLSSMILPLICFKVLNKGEYPFSEKFEVTEQGGIKIFLLLALIGGLFLLHSFFDNFENGLSIYIFILLVVNGLGWNFAFKKRRVFE